MDSAVFLLLASLGYIDGGTAPIVGDQGFDPLYINPIPSGLVLTGIGGIRVHHSVFPGL